MKILHTADVHIREINDARWEALGEIVDIGNREQVEVLTICGDLFDNSEIGQKLRPKIREIFTAANYPVLIIPGNHDIDAYPDGAFLGEKVTVMRDLMQPVVIDGIAFWGFPFTYLDEEAALAKLHQAADRVNADMPNILLFHGELLDKTGGWDIYGEEGRQRYLPVKLSYFTSLPWQHVLAGHLHSNFDNHEFSPGRYFVYPGSPVSITRKELGIRHLNLFVLGEMPEKYPINTTYYEKFLIHLDPFQSLNPLLPLKERIEKIPPGATLLLEVAGYYNGAALQMTETMLHEKIMALADDRVEITALEFRDIREIVEDDLFKSFAVCLDKKGFPAAERREILEIALQGMMER